MKYIYVLPFFLTSIISWAQQDTDSLNNLLKVHSGQDSLRVDVLNQLSYSYWIVDPARAEKLSREALMISTDKSYLEGMAMANRSIGVTNWAQGNYEEGLDALLTSLSQYQLLRDTLNIANVMMNTGLIYSEQGSFEEALQYYEEALMTFTELEKPEREVNTLNHMGELHQKQGLLSLAKARYQEALRKSIAANNYTYGKSTALSHLSTLYQSLNKLDSALDYADEALAIQTTANDLNGRAFSLYNIGMIHQKKSNYSLAHKYYLLALNEATVISSKKLKRDTYLKLKQIAKIRGDYEEALDYAEKYSIVNDSLFNAEKLREFVRLESKFALERNEQELKLQEQELNLLKRDSEISALWRNLLMVVILAILIISYFVYSRQKLQIKRKKELYAKNEEVYLANEALSKAELENARLKEIELNQQIDFKNKELTSYTVNFMQKNELLEEIKSFISEMKKSQDGSTISKLNSLSRLVTNGMHIDKDWQDFKRQFEEVHTDFFNILKNKYPSITQNELKLCALLKLNMNLKEAATVLGISPESVKTARYRLRKKMDLDKEANLVDHIISIEEEAVS